MLRRTTCVLPGGMHKKRRDENSEGLGLVMQEKIMMMTDFAADTIEAKLEPFILSAIILPLTQARACEFVNHAHVVISFSCILKTSSAARSILGQY